MKFKRHMLNAETTDKVVGCLQQRLIELIDLALQLKQAHWCVVGNNFRAVHLQLDEIILAVRDASDEVAERLSTIGVAPDGRANTVANGSQLTDLSREFESVSNTVTTVADRMDKTIQGLRDSIGKLGELDPISEDMLIAITSGLEKHLWMVQAQEA
ncbi:Dps family protein [Bythopirellula goksoeyrii]|uniref:Fine tangled pili major subunit n=1 Tax=Bythopirellula goksoeyrii TaxID=1400387 RepID=A0A5B9QHZ6_9BACT|nr:DNA starvation/stationary phase protection protein [Bythopirellula goksoeyrii]QEG37579.1 Fine tangled pili major subunit [Bythopirellula goksoeyrii]